VSLSATAGAVTTDDLKIVNARDVVDVCSVAKTDPYYTAAINFCHGYGVGTFDVYQALMSRPGARHFVCMSEPRPPRSQVIEQFVAWMNAHPQYDNEHPTNAIFKFFAEKWPCKRS
jgi:hypothetical protein